eukprot:3804149-Amphidinium_carterae.1
MPLKQSASIEVTTWKKKCALTRTAVGRRRAGRVVAGRPVGFMACWLSRAHAGDRAAHWDKHLNKFGHAERKAMREQVLAVPGGPELLAFERAKEDNEDSEPEDLVGLWP